MPRRYVAALRRARRSATATAITRTSLLVLDAQDLHALMDRDPRVANRIREVVRSRIGRDIVSPRGDVITEELEEAETLEPAHGGRARP
jgi:voltage-gated potassium channel